jgi:WhiB family transcriptional regulator, redox-sensing transcriptional regulator
VTSVDRIPLAVLGGMTRPVVRVSKPEPWRSYAACTGVDPDLFFPERGASTREAKEVCRGCVVREDCLEYALTNREKFGIWGGLSERERRRLRRQRHGLHL